MDYVIVFDDGEGPAKVMVPYGGLRREGESELDFAHRIAAKDLPVGVLHAVVVSRDAMPTDRTFRNAWVVDTGVTVDLDKAKAIQVERWRQERKPLLEALDVEVSKALVSGGKAAVDAAEAKRQALRDVTKTDLSGIKSVAELKAFRPAALTP